MSENIPILYKHMDNFLRLINKKLSKYNDII